MNATLSTVQVDWLQHKDVLDCVWIDGASFQQPLSAENLRAWLRARNGRHIGIVCRSMEQQVVLGYALYRLHDRSLHVERLAVSPHCRQQGVATCLLLRLIWKVQGEGRRRCITTACEERNLPVQRLLRALGFRCISSRPDAEVPGERVYFFRYLSLSPEVL